MHASYPRHERPAQERLYDCTIVDGEANDTRLRPRTLDLRVHEKASRARESEMLIYTALVTLWRGIKKAGRFGLP